jgi:hypothetical protein
MQPRLMLGAILAVTMAACSSSDGKTGAIGANGADGTNGSNGTNGTDGKVGATGSNGSNGSDGTNGTVGVKGANGTNGTDGTNGNDVILSETARTGLVISRVAVDLKGLDGDQVESVGRGSYLVNAVADCTGCHNGVGSQGETLFLAGNIDFPLGGFDPNNPGARCTVGTGSCVDGHVFTRNLTPHATTGLKLTEDQFVQVLRTGRDFKDATGATTLLVMPWPELRWLTDRDLRDIYHYLGHIPAIDNAVQGDTKPIFPPPPSPFFASNGDPIAAPVYGDGVKTRPLPVAFDPKAGKPTALAGEQFDGDNVLRGLAISPLNDDTIVAGMTATQQALYGRGSYIVNGPGLCNECHTVGGRDQVTNKVKATIFLAGGQSFAVPPPLQPILGQVRTMSGNLTGENAGFTQPFSVFLNTWLSGMSFTKATPHPLGFPMPFDVFRNMTNQDKEAVFTYISTIQKNSLVTGDKPHQAPARYCTTATVAADCKGVGETCDATTHTCVNGDCDNPISHLADDSMCGACQACDSGTHKCLAENPSSSNTAAADCVKNSF